jgi:hypothetical protein
VDSVIGSTSNPNYYNPEDCKKNDYIIKQNKEIIKTSKYYYIDYQYILIEGSPSGGSESELLRRLVKNNNLDYYPFSRIYLGRINRLQFKLCHDYCETCYELDESKENHRCFN